MRSSFSLIAVLSLLVASLTAQEASDAKHFFYMPMWPGAVCKFDPATDEVVKITKFKRGLHFGVRLSWDRKQFYGITAKKQVVEVVDRATMTVVEEHDFGQKGYIIRVGTIREVPGGREWYVQLDRIKKNLDRYKIEDDQFLHYDRVEKKILKKLKKMPRAIRSAKISPCGKFWHVFGKDLKILDPKKDNEEVGIIELSKPLYRGMGAIRLRGADFLDGKDHDRYRMMYTMKDPVKTKRSIAGIVDINLKEKRLENLIEWGRDPGLWNLRVSQNKKWGVASKGGGGGVGGGGGGRGRSSSDERETKLVVYNLETGQKVGEKDYVFRPRRSLATISPDGLKIYVGGAGNDFDVYDRNFNKLKTVNFPGDLSGRVWTLEG